MERIKKKKTSKVICFVGGAILTAAGFILISPLIKDYSNKTYKISVSNENIDFDNIGPEIIKKKDNGKEE